MAISDSDVTDANSKGQTWRARYNIYDMNIFPNVFMIASEVCTPAMFELMLVTGSPLVAQSS
jgi:hypothetical protein